MKRRLVLAVSLTMPLLGAEYSPPDAQRQRPPCCSNNPRYAGTCVVEPGDGETCRSVLAYLNDPKAAGKTYCSNTTIRGGWKAVRCKPAGGGS
jgi:hypothetical protein